MASSLHCRLRKAQTGHVKDCARRRDICGFVKCSASSFEVCGTCPNPEASRHEAIRPVDFQLMQDSFLAQPFDRTASRRRSIPYYILCLIPSTFSSTAILITQKAVF